MGFDGMLLLVLWMKFRWKSCVIKTFCDADTTAAGVGVDFSAPLSGKRDLTMFCVLQRLVVISLSSVGLMALDAE